MIDATRQLLRQMVGIPLIVVDERTPAKLAMPQEEVALFLIDSARGEAHQPCGVGPDCEVCELFRIVWWDWYASLDRVYRMGVQRVAIRQGFPLPTNPRERVEG